MEKMKRRDFGKFVMFSAAAMMTPSIGGAFAMEAGQVAHRLNKADRLSMLAERVAKSIALIRLDLNVADNIAQMQEAHDEFDDILVGFLLGEGNSGVTKERIVGVKNQVKAVEALWVPMRTSVEEVIASGKVDDEHFEWIESHDVELEHAAHEVVKAIEKAYGADDIDPGLAIAMDLAGAQRMLTQRMAKDLALTALGYHSEESHEDFEKSCKKFGKIVEVLLTGGANIMTIAKPPTDSAYKALEAVKAHWMVMEPLAKELHANEKPPADQVGLFAEQSEKLLTECEAVSVEYEKFAAGIV